MNLEKLFEMQKELRNRINYQGKDRFENLVLALLVEVGECANEWRGFKFWSVNQLPHTSAVRVPCMMDEDKEFYNPLLEEYVDGLHFFLELGIEFKVNLKNISRNLSVMITENKKYGSIQQHFAYIYNRTSRFLDPGYEQKGRKFDYLFLLNAYVGLGKRLGFTWEQVEQAYFEKNKINHQRQESGY